MYLFILYRFSYSTQCRVVTSYMCCLGMLLTAAATDRLLTLFTWHLRLLTIHLLHLKSSMTSSEGE